MTVEIAEAVVVGEAGMEIVVMSESGVRVEKPAVAPGKVADSVTKMTVTSSVVVCVVAARTVVVCAAAAESYEVVDEAEMVTPIGKIVL